jgi:trans-aconitate methyltransferase
MKTKRIQNNQIMSSEEKKDFSKIIRTTQWLYSPILDQLKNLRVKTLCDVACGDGYLLELIRKKYPDLGLTGIDIDSEFIKNARKNVSANFRKIDAFKLKEKFDVITLNLALHHFDNTIGLIRHLLSLTNKTLIISDQIRPKNEKELIQRLEKRKKIVGNNETYYYDENEKSSILEAYSEEEIKKIFNGFNCELTFIDNDYYKRFVCVIENDLNKQSPCRS